MPPGFLTELECELIPGSDDKWEVKAPLVYQSEVAIFYLLPTAGKITAPAGFVTDFASVPRVPVVYTLFGDRAHREAVIHDYLYQTHLVPKAIADKVFKEAMAARGKGWFVRWGMYLGVVLGGASSYKSGPSRYQQLNDGGA